MLPSIVKSRVPVPPLFGRAAPGVLPTINVAGSSSLVCYRMGQPYPRPMNFAEMHARGGGGLWGMAF